jgi:uncharacterized membrane protein
MVIVRDFAHSAKAVVGRGVSDWWDILILGWSAEEGE